ncbi:MAG TPA: hypothetical protein PKD26_13205 [Pyrinomonadaceae bacterium]|nr:hypothetical protein [Pyrinomonadaceae bacterium]
MRNPNNPVRQSSVTRPSNAFYFTQSGFRRKKTIAIRINLDIAVDCGLKVEPNTVTVTAEDDTNIKDVLII